MSVSDMELSSGVKLKDYAEIVNKTKKLTDLDLIIAKNRENIFKVFQNEFTTERGEDLKTLTAIKDAYDEKLGSLGEELWKESKNFSLKDNKSLEKEWKDNLKYTFANKKIKNIPLNIPVLHNQIKKIRENVNTLIEKLKYLELDEDWEKTWTTFNSINFDEENLWDSTDTLETLFNENDAGNISNNISNIISENNTPINTTSQFLEMQEQIISKRIWIFILLVKKYLSNHKDDSDKKLSATMTYKLNSKLEQCITIATKLRTIHNINCQLEYINWWIKELTNLWNIQKTKEKRWEIDLTNENSKEIKDTDFQETENWAIRDIQDYSIDSNKISLKNAQGVVLWPIKITNDQNTVIDPYTKNINDKNSTDSISVTINDKDIKIWKIQRTKWQWFTIIFLKEDDIKDNAKDQSIALSCSPRYFDIPLKGSKPIKTRNYDKKIGNSTVSHTKHYTGKLQIHGLSSTPIENYTYTPKKDFIQKIFAVLSDKTDYTETEKEKYAGEKFNTLYNDNLRKEREEQEALENGEWGSKIWNFMKKVWRRKRLNLTRGQEIEQAKKEWKEKMYNNDFNETNIFSDKNQQLASRSLYEGEVIKNYSDDQLDQMCRKYLTTDDWSEETTLANDLKTRMASKGFEINNKYASNLKEQLEKKKGFKKLIEEIDDLVNKTEEEAKGKQNDINTKINKYIMQQKDAIPELYQQFKGWESEKIKFDDFKNYISNERKCLDLETKNYEIHLKVTKAKAANHISDKHQKNRAYTLGKVANRSAFGKFLLERTGLSQGFSAFTDYTNEQKQFEYKCVEDFDAVMKEAKTYENYITDYEKGNYKEEGKRLNSLKNRLWYKKAKSRMAKYKTTVEHLEDWDKLKKNIDTALKDYLSSPSSDPKEMTERSTKWKALVDALIQGYVRIQLHKETWNNFLYSKSRNIEKTTAELLSSFTVGIKTLTHKEHLSEKEIIERLKTYGSQGQETYENAYKRLNTQYEKNQKQFKKERNLHAWKYGLFCGIPRFLWFIWIGKIFWFWMDDSWADIIDPATNMTQGADMTPKSPISESLPQSKPYNVKDYFNPTLHDVPDAKSNIIQWITEHFDNIKPEDFSNSTIDIEIGAWTDGIPWDWGGPEDSIVTEKLTEVQNNIRGLEWLSKSQKDRFISSLDNIQVPKGKDFTSPNLWKMRMYENIEQIAKGFSNKDIHECSNLTINISHDEDLDIAGEVWTNNIYDKVAQAKITRTKEISNDMANTNIPEDASIEEDPNHPWVFRKVVTWSTPTQIAPLFNNTVSENSDNLPKAA